MIIVPASQFRVMQTVRVTHQDTRL